MSAVLPPNFRSMQLTVREGTGIIEPDDPTQLSNSNIVGPFECSIWVEPRVAKQLERLLSAWGEVVVKPV